jgi:hypothetical protein
VAPLQILCAVAVFRTVYHASGAVTHALGELYPELRRQLAYAALVVLTSLAGTRWGVVGVSLGVAVSILFMYLAMAQLVVRCTGCGWRAFFAVQLPGLMVAALVAGAALAARMALERTLQSSVAILLGIIAVCAATVPVGVYLLPRRIRPTDLFRKLDLVVERLPRVVRPPIRRVLSGTSLVLDRPA